MVQLVLQGFTLPGSCCCWCLGVLVSWCPVFGLWPVKACLFDLFACRVCRDWDFIPPQVAQWGKDAKRGPISKRGGWFVYCTYSSNLLSASVSASAPSSPKPGTRPSWRTRKVKAKGAVLMEHCTIWFARDILIGPCKKRDRQDK